MEKNIEDDPKFWEWLEEKFQKRKNIEERKDMFKRLVLDLPVPQKIEEDASEAENPIYNINDTNPSNSLYEDYEVDISGDTCVVYKF